MWSSMDSFYAILEDIFIIKIHIDYISKECQNELINQKVDEEAECMVSELE